MDADADLKANLHRYLQQARAAMAWKLTGLSEYDVRRPLTPTGTNLLLAADKRWWAEHRDRVERAAQTARSDADPQATRKTGY